MFRDPCRYCLSVTPEKGTETKVELWYKDKANAVNSSVSLDSEEVFSHVEQVPLNLAARRADLVSAQADNNQYKLQARH